MSNLDDELARVLGLGSDDFKSHLEMFAAAYYQRTGLDPRKTVLYSKIITGRDGTTWAYWFGPTSSSPAVAGNCPDEGEEVKLLRKTCALLAEQLQSAIRHIKLLTKEE